MRSDEDRELHNHPCRKAWSLILTGRYAEERRAEDDFVRTRIYYPGQINRIDANTFHRVDLLDGPMWTLFVMANKNQDWGFWNRRTKEFMPWKDFLRMKGFTSFAIEELPADVAREPELS